jgi:hypothetical protein
LTTEEIEFGIAGRAGGFDDEAAEDVAVPLIVEFVATPFGMTAAQLVLRLPSLFVSFENT